MVRLVQFVVAALVALAIVVITRTLLHAPPSVSDAATLKIPLDEARVARHLAEAIRFQTVSHQSPEDMDEAQFECLDAPALRWRHC